MNMQATQFLKICGLSLSLTLIGQMGHSAALKATETKVNLSPERPSLMEKALQQQRKDSKILRDENDLRVLTEIKVAPTQSFLPHKIKDSRVSYKPCLSKIILNLIFSPLGSLVV